MSCYRFPMAGMLISPNTILTSATAASSVPPALPKTTRTVIYVISI